MKQKHLFSNPEIMETLPKLNIKTNVIKQLDEKAVCNFNHELNMIVSRHLKNSL